MNRFIFLLGLLVILCDGSDKTILQLLRMDTDDLKFDHNLIPTMRNMEPNFVQDLAKLRLKDTIMEELWKSILPQGRLSRMTRRDWSNYEAILSTLPQYFLPQMNVTDQGLIEYFGTIQKLNFRQLATFGDLLQNTFGKYLLDDGKMVLKLGNLLCGFSKNQLGRIKASTFRFLLRKGFFKLLGGCSRDQLRTLLQVGYQYTAIGPPASWNAEVVSDLGYLLAGLEEEQIQEIQPKSWSKVPVSIIELIPAEILTVMRTEQVRSLRREVRMLWRRKTNNSNFISSSVVAFLNSPEVTLYIFLNALFFVLF